MLTFTDNPETKLVPDLPFADYWDAPGINNSSLPWYDEWSGGAPAMYRFYVEHPEHRPEPSAALLDGSCYHYFVLCPDSFEQFYTVRTAEIEADLFAAALGEKSKAKGFSCNLATYKAWKADQEACGKLVITSDRRSELHWMREALFRCDEFREMFDSQNAEMAFTPKGGGSSGTTQSRPSDADREVSMVSAPAAPFQSAALEVSAFCGYEFRRGWLAGKRLQLKARLDIVPAGDALLDLKSARTAHRIEFARQVWNLGYNRQAAFHLDCYNANAGGAPKTRFGFLAQDKTPPYLACIHWVNNWLDHGRRRYEVILSNLAESIARNRWPGYESGELEPPEWARAELEAA